MSIKRLTKSLILCSSFCLVAHHALAEEKPNTPDYQKKIKELTPKAEKGDPKAQYELGLLYYENGGTSDEDIIRVRKLMTKASNQGNKKAIYFLNHNQQGLICLNLKKLKPKKADCESLRFYDFWIEKFAKTGNIRAQILFSEYYIEKNNFGFKHIENKKDNQNAIFWLTKAAENISMENKSKSITKKKKYNIPASELFRIYSQDISILHIKNQKNEAKKWAEISCSENPEKYDSSCAYLKKN